MLVSFALALLTCSANQVSPMIPAAAAILAPRAMSGAVASPSRRGADALPALDPAVWTTVGAAIPSLELPRIDGQGSIDLARYRGKKLLLIQFASW